MELVVVDGNFLMNNIVNKSVGGIESNFVG